MYFVASQLRYFGKEVVDEIEGQEGTHCQTEHDCEEKYHVPTTKIRKFEKGDEKMKVSLIHARSRDTRGEMYGREKRVVPMFSIEPTKRRHNITKIYREGQAEER